MSDPQLNLNSKVGVDTIMTLHHHHTNSISSISHLVTFNIYEHATFLNSVLKELLPLEMYGKKHWENSIILGNCTDNDHREGGVVKIC